MSGNHVATFMDEHHAPKRCLASPLFHEEPAAICVFPGFCILRFRLTYPEQRAGSTTQLNNNMKTNLAPL